MSNLDQFPQLWCGVEWIDAPDSDLRDEKFFPAVIVILHPDADGDPVTAALDVFPANCREAFSQPEKVAAFFARWERYAQEHRQPFEFNDQIYERAASGGLVLLPLKGVSHDRA